MQTRTHLLNIIPLPDHGKRKTRFASPIIPALTCFYGPAMNVFTFLEHFYVMSQMKG